jgi:hypothetical protein
MAWTTPVTWTTNQLVTAADLNTQVRDNLGYLLSGRPVDVKVVSNIWTITSTSYVDVDATNLSATLTVNSGRALVWFEGRLLGADVVSKTGQITLLVDGVDQYTGDGLAKVGRNASRDLAYLIIVSGLSVGSHTFKLQGKCNDSGFSISIGENTAGDYLCKRKTVFGAMEV